MMMRRSGAQARLAEPIRHVYAAILYAMSVIGRVKELRHTTMMLRFTLRRRHCSL